MMHRYKMKDLYPIAGLTKQALSKSNRRVDEVQALKEVCLDLAKDVRTRHKRMGVRSIYYACHEKPPVGRDRFIAITMDNGYRLKRRRNKQKTTWSQRVEIFPNLIEGMEVTRINQIWQSDIFYCQDQGKDYYGVTIIDVYSKQLTALHLSRSLKSIENIKALKHALKGRTREQMEGCIFHSDRGVQYIHELHKSILKENGFVQSMCKLPQENAYAEKVQDTIKNAYLDGYTLSSKNLRQVAKRIMYLYNEEKPHTSLNMLSPNAFEKYVETLPDETRPKELIFKWNPSLSTNSELLTKRKK